MQTKRTGIFTLSVGIVFIALGCTQRESAQKEPKFYWEQARTAWQQVVALNQEFKGMVYSNPGPSLKEFYQAADANIERLNQIMGQTKTMPLPFEWKKDFNQGLQANISYYKTCKIIIDKSARGGQSYDELRDLARDCLILYQKCVSEDWSELPRETFQIAAKLEGFIGAVKPSPPKVVVEKTRPERVTSSFVTARGVGLLPDSQFRNLTEADLYDYSAWELDIIRNEIYARHGRKFIKAKYQNYFNSQPWYEVNPNYSDSILSSIEKRNSNFISHYQKKTGKTTG